MIQSFSFQKYKKKFNILKSGWKIWLFDFCEALACVSGKRQCAKCVSAFRFSLCGSAKKLNLFPFKTVIPLSQYFVFNSIISFQVCTSVSFPRLVGKRWAYEEWRVSKRVVVNRGRKLNRSTALGNPQTPPLLICRVMPCAFFSQNVARIVPL